MGLMPRRVAVRLFLFFYVTLWSAVAVPAQPAASPPSDFDSIVQKALKTFEVPGLSLAIVKDGRVVVAKGYGVRTLGDPAPVDAETLFGIASNTKVFTAAALGILVDAGKVEWDAPVVGYLPWFQMWDPWVTRELTVRDLLVHRSGLGLGAGDLLWWPESTYDRKEIARRVRFIPPATSFRSAYAYDNVLYLVAGEVIETVSGQSWEDFVATRILAPVGMSGSNVKHSAAAKGGNVAATHARVEGTTRKIRPFESDNTNPAGGINSNAQDMARWMSVLLARGRISGGNRLFSEKVWRELTTLVTPMPVSDLPPEFEALRPNFMGYALGLSVSDYRGRKVLAHTGGLPGYVSRVTMVPDLNLGIAVLTNAESGAAFNAVTTSILDSYLDAPRTDWIDLLAKVQARMEAAALGQIKKDSSSRDRSSRPSLPLESYAATYVDPWYGEIGVTLESGRLVMKFSHTPALIGDLEHWQHDSFIVRWRDRELRADAYVTFALNPDGSIDHARMRAVSSETDFSFDFHDLLLTPKTP
jgi:CubicO group peptidase (beta-lactamase class C family)